MTPWIPWTTEVTPAEPAWRWLAQCLGMPALLATPARPRTEMQLPASRLPNAARHKLSALLGERLHTDDEARIAHVEKADAAGVLRLRGGDLSQAPDAVLRPRNEDEVLALLQICAEAGIAVGPGNGRHPVRVICDTSGMSEILSLDAVSGLVQVQAGISSAELARQLAARGMAFGPAEFSDLGHRSGQYPEGVVGMRLATPQGLFPSGVLPGPSDGFGIVTAATLRIRSLPASTLHLEYLFPDFASGFAAMREAQRECVAQISAALSDAEETRFYRRLAAMTKPTTRMQRMTDIIRGQPGDGAAALRITISGGAADVEISRKRFAALARKLGAQTWDGVADPDYRPLLNRGVTVDCVHASATWSNLPVLYAALRTALDQAMRLQAPRTGAHGLVLAQVTDARHDGANLTCTFLFPRLLNGDVAQAQAVRRAALDVLAAQRQPARDPELRRAIAAILDPGGIITSEES
jgi:alkyldihydroxyacetonephosphate synthase